MRTQQQQKQTRRRALIIGCNYTGTPAQLNGCVNDAADVATFLVGERGWLPGEIRILHDGAWPNTGNLLAAALEPKPACLPTRANILHALGWLVAGALRGDTLRLHFSGHGGQLLARVAGSEPSGYDSTILPCDYRSGQITDNELRATLLTSEFVASGAELLAVFDSCHSGTALDLRFNYTSGERAYEYAVKKSLERQKDLLGDFFDFARTSLSNGATALINAAINGISSSAAVDELRKITACKREVGDKETDLEDRVNAENKVEGGEDHTTLAAAANNGIEDEKENLSSSISFSRHVSEQLREQGSEEHLVTGKLDAVVRDVVRSSIERELSRWFTPADVRLAMLASESTEIFAEEESGVCNSVPTLRAVDMNVFAKRAITTKPRVLNNQSQVVMVSGCADNGTSADAMVGSKWNGALTHALLLNLRADGGSRGHCAVSLLSSIGKTLTSEGYGQRPQLSAEEQVDATTSFDF